MNNVKVEIFGRIYINGEETDYEISDHGRLRNLKTGKFVKGYIDRGRVIYAIHHKKVQYRKTALRWMTMTFLELPDGSTDYNKYHADHIDEHKGNDILKNSQWLTPSENSKKHQASKNSYGLNNPFGKLSDEEIHKIFQYALKDNLRPIEIAEKMHLNRSTVVKTLSGKLHKNIFDQYDMSKYNMKYGSRGKYSNDIRSQMISLYNDGYKFSEIQKILNLPDSSYNAIRKIIKQSKSKKYD